MECLNVFFVNHYDQQLSQLEVFPEPGILKIMVQ